MCDRHRRKCDLASEQERAEYDYEALAAAFAQAQQWGMHVANPYGPNGKDVDQSSTAIAAAMMGVVSTIGGERDDPKLMAESGRCQPRGPGTPKRSLYSATC